jgi:hypothetical protein
VVRAFLNEQIADGTLPVPQAEPLHRVLMDGFHGALVAVAHEVATRDDFVAVARYMGGALLTRR